MYLLTFLTLINVYFFIIYLFIDIIYFQTMASTQISNLFGLVWIEFEPQIS